MKNVMCVKMNDASLNDSHDDTTKIGNSSCSLPAPANVSSEVWEHVVSKAQAIASNPASMSPVPGGSAKRRFVLSFRSPGSPLKVQAGKFPVQYTCDNKKCPAYASYKICSHVLAVAMQNKECEELLKTCHSSKGVSLHDVAMIRMQKNAGKNQGTLRSKAKRRNLCRTKIVYQPALPKCIRSLLLKTQALH